MPMPKLLAIVTAMMLMSSPAAGQQAFSISQLRKIESLIVSKDCGALRAYLRANPRFTIGNDPLAVELRTFASDVDRGRVQCFGTSAVAGRPGLPASKATSNQSSNSAPIY